MSQHAGPEDGDDIELAYSNLSSLPAGKRPYTPPAGLPHGGRQAPEEPGEPESVRTARGAWPYPYHRVLNAAFLGALFAVGVLLGTVVSGYAASVRSLPGSATLSSHSGESTATAAVDAHYAIVTLGIQCLRDLCEAPHRSQYVPAGQRVYALHGGWSCTTLSVAEVTSYHEQYVYCRLDQSNAFTTTFDGAPFDCVGSRLGCHFVVQVKTTDGR